MKGFGDSQYGSAFASSRDHFVAGAKYSAGARRSFNIVAICLCLILPWLMFTSVSGVLSFAVHYTQPWLCTFVVNACLFVVVFFAYLAYSAWRRKSLGHGEPSWFCFLFLASLIAWSTAYMMGTSNYATNMLPYYDAMNLNVYPLVDPQVYNGQQLMDLGRAVFVPGSRLDITKSMGFRNVDIYCVAPIVSGNNTLSTFDFWAVGLNCCSGHAADFHCGEFNNPMAHSGLRLMRDDLRPYYMLAVEQAEASYNIKAAHPIFLHWMQDPMAEVNAYKDAGAQEYILAVLTFFALNLFAIIIAVVIFSKHSY
eukprot:TRINITY_DN5664_c0_g1_i1.p1 TRINITY_DN5664_c0_g1~~TRINITY_DN5664_c0_g1_i1.p1  ORF type:complete len:310 (+),score=33.63 TRINITY_DN5664_c0_g1_i1:166-1095(+)